MATARKTALISGANKGLGFETARQLARRGVLVYLGARDIEAGRRAADSIAGDAEVVPVRLDVTDPSSVAETARHVGSDERCLDILINNAGHIVEAPAVRTTAATTASVFATNVFGAVELTTACLPMLARSSAPRIVNVSSTTASLSLTAAGHDFGGDASSRMAYASSKSALNMVTLQLAAALRDDAALAHVAVNSVTPGFVATDINAHQGTRGVEDGARVIVDMALVEGDAPSGGFVNDRGPVPW